MLLTDISGYTAHSHKQVQVECDFGISEKCRGTYQMTIKDMNFTRSHNDGKDICVYCSRRLKASGSKNANSKYSYNEDFFENIDTREKAYILGWIASDGHISKNKDTIVISIHRKDGYILKPMNTLIGGYIKNKLAIPPMIDFAIHNKKMARDVCRHLDISGGKKSGIANFPDIAEPLVWDFIRGLFDGDGCIHGPDKRGDLPMECGIASTSERMMDGLKKWVPYGVYSSGNAKYKTTGVRIAGANAIDFLGKLYDNADWMKLKRKYQRYRYMMSWHTWPYKKSICSRFDGDIVMRYKKVYKDAVAPYKKNASDSGFDLTIIKLLKQDGDIYLYDTGIAIQPQFNWYLDIVPRSSLYSSGYMLANNVGIVDQTYRGTLKVPLYKFDKTKPDLVLPLRVVQIIPRLIIHPVLVEETEDSVSCDIPDMHKKTCRNGYVLGNGDNQTWWVTSRGDKGFGSSGK